MPAANLTTKLQDIKNEKLALRGVLTTTLKIAEAEVPTFSEYHTAFETKIGELNAQIESLKDQMEDPEHAGQIADLEAQVSTLTAQKAELESEKADLEAAKTALEGEKTEIETIVDEILA